VHGLLAKRALALDGPATVTAYAMLFGTLLLLPWALVEGLVPAAGRLHGRILAVVVFVGVLLVNWPGRGRAGAGRVNPGRAGASPARGRPGLRPDPPGNSPWIPRTPRPGLRRELPSSTQTPQS
jgi:hypothetical protein